MNNANVELPQQVVARTRAAIYFFAAAAVDREVYGAVLSERLQEGVCSRPFDALSIADASRQKPELAIVSVDDALRQAHSCVRFLREQTPSTKIIVLLSQRCPDMFEADGDFVRVAKKDEGFIALLQQVRAARANQPEPPRKHIRLDSNTNRSRALSPRERELLPLLANGTRLRIASEQLGMAYKTADAVRTRIYRKLRITRQAQLVAWAIREGIV